MPKKKKTVKLSPNEENLRQGLMLVEQNPLFSRLGGYKNVCDKAFMGKNTAAYVTSSGQLYLNKDYPMQPKEWAYTVAHCMLHLAFGHFDADHMPGYEIPAADGPAAMSKGKTSEDAQKAGRWQVSCNKHLWNIACDIYISKFLADIKFGKEPKGNLIQAYQGPTSDERKIYAYLVETNYDASDQKYGTASPHEMDMQGLNEPLEYKDSWNSKNTYAVKFAYALAYSVSHVVSEAGGHTIGGRKAMTPADKAAQWFINHYPLLGGLAAGFRIYYDFDLCNKNEISIAAVDVTNGEIFVNPAAGLSDEELRFVLAHEFLHAGLLHHERCKGRDPYLWNIACDFVINAWLMKMQVGQMPAQGLLYDEKLEDVSSEELYDRIVTDLKKMSKQSTFRGYGKGDIIGRERGSFDQKKASDLEDFYRSALQNGLEYHLSEGRGYLPAGLIEEIRALSMPPIPWDVKLGKWFDVHFLPLERRRSYARPSRRQGSTPDIPRPRYIPADIPEHSRTFGVVIDTSGSMSAKLIGYALGAVASYAVAKEVPYARVVFCDAFAYDAGYLAPEDIAGRVSVKGRGGTILQPGVDLLIKAKDFPKDGPILIITDGFIEEHMTIQREHAFLVPRGRRLPFRPKGEIFYFEES